MENRTSIAINYVGDTITTDMAAMQISGQINHYSHKHFGAQKKAPCPLCCVERYQAPCEKWIYNYNVLTETHRRGWQGERYISPPSEGIGFQHIQLEDVLCILSIIYCLIYIYTQHHKTNKLCKFKVYIFVLNSCCQR